VGEREIRREIRTRFDQATSADDEVGASDLIARLERFEAAAWEGGGRDAWRRFDLDPIVAQAVGRVRDSLTAAMGLGRDPEPEGTLADEEERLLLATLLAFPDRVGRRRRQGEEEIVLAAGGSARLAESSVVRESEYVVAVEVSEAPRRGRMLRVASHLEPEWLLEHFAERIGEEEAVLFDSTRERVYRRRALSFEGLVLDESTSFDIAPEEGAEVLAEAALAAGFQSFCDPEAFESLKLRAAFARTNGGPDISLDDELLRSALRASSVHALSFDDLRAARPWEELRTAVGEGTLQSLDRFAPSAVRIGASGRVAVSYELDRPPWIEARLQDFFGMSDGPKVAGGQVALVLHLLAPNRRAVQVTTDLAGFWDRHYPSLRKSLMRRYSRHYWPEDPRTAEAPRAGLKRHVGKGPKGT